MTATLAFYSPLVGSSFTVETQAGIVALQLTEARERPRNGLPEQFRTPLSLAFTGTRELVLAQDLYYVSHPAMERQVWTIVPVSAGPAQMSAIPPRPDTLQHYQVIFN